MTLEEKKEVEKELGITCIDVNMNLTKEEYKKNLLCLIDDLMDKGIFSENGRKLVDE